MTLLLELGDPGIYKRAGAWKKHQPGCPCCESCYLSTNFQEADWTIEDGTPTWNAGVNQVTLDDSDTRMFNIRGQSYSFQKWLVEATATPHATDCNIVFGMRDFSGDNQLYVVLELEDSGASTARLNTTVYSITGGGAPVLESGPTSTGWFAYSGGAKTIFFGVHYDEDYSRLTYWTMGLLDEDFTTGATLNAAISENLTLHADMRYPVIGTDTSANDVDGIYFEYSHCFCPAFDGTIDPSTGEPSSCDQLVGPSRVRVDISGVAAGDAICTTTEPGTFEFDWDLFNANHTCLNRLYEWVRRELSIDPIGSLLLCSHSKVIQYQNDPLYNQNLTYVTFTSCYDSDADETTLTVDLYQYVIGEPGLECDEPPVGASATATVSWSSVIAGRVDTRTLSAEPLTFDSEEYADSGSIDWSGATITVIVLP